MAWGGKREGAGRKKINPNKAPVRAEPRIKPADTKVGTGLLPAETKTGPAIDPRALMMMLPEIEEISKQYAVNKARRDTPHLNPFKLPAFPKSLLDSMEKSKAPTMAMDSALGSNLSFAANGWLA